MSLIYVKGRERIMQKETSIECQEQTKNNKDCFCSNWNDEHGEKICQSITSDKYIKFDNNIFSSLSKYIKNVSKNGKLSLNNFDQSSEFYKFGFYALIVAMIGDLLISFLLSMFYIGYSNTKMSISALGNPKSPVRWPFNIWMFVEGILFLFAITSLYKYYYPISNGVTIVMIIFISLFAIGACILTSFFSVNESKDIITVSSKIHEVGSSLGFTLFLFVPLLVSILSFKNKEIIIGIISIICFAVGLFFFILLVMSEKESFSNSFINNEGIW